MTEQEKEPVTLWTNDAHLSDRDQFAIGFKTWCDKLPTTAKITVHPPAGSGGSKAVRELTNEELLENYLYKQSLTKTDKK